MTFEEWSKKQKMAETRESIGGSALSADQKAISQTAPVTTVSFADWSRRKKLQSPSTTVEEWIQSTNHVGEVARAYCVKWNGDIDGNQTYNEIQARVNTLLAQADGWRKQYTGNEEAVSHIDTVVKALENVKDQTHKARNYYAQWETAEDYASAEASAKYYTELQTYDLVGTAGTFLEKSDLIKRKIQNDALYERIVADTAEALKGTNQNVRFDYTAHAKEQIADLLERLKTLDPDTAEYRNMSGTDLLRYMEEQRVIDETLARWGYVDYNTFKAAYDEEEHQRNVAAYTQKGLVLYEDAINAEDFAEKNQYDPKAKYDAEYRFINGETLTAEAFEKLPAILKNMRQYMTADEIAVYNYYYAKRGKDAASKYLRVIEDGLTTRHSAEMFNGMEGNRVLALPFAVVAGLDQFGGGIKNAVEGREDYVPASAIQKTSAQVREDLYGDGGVSGTLKRGIYDVVTAAANMAPSALTSLAATALATKATGNPVAGAKFGSVVGSTLMGVSAGGNAYAEAINNGYSKEQARLYSTMVGASEAGLQMLLGGVSKLGGVATGRVMKAIDTIDNTFARVPLKIGTSMLAEGTEEALQEMLTPLFKRIAADEKVAINWGAVSESFVIGALVGALYSSPSIIVGDVQQTRIGNVYLRNDELRNGLKDLALQLPADSEAYALAQNLTEEADARRVGALFNAVCEELGVDEKVGTAAVVGNSLRLTAEQSAQGYRVITAEDTAGVTEADVEEFRRTTGMDVSTKDLIDADSAVDEDSALVQATHAEREANAEPYTPPRSSKDVKAYSTAETDTYSRVLSRVVYMYDGASHAHAEAGFAENGAVYINKNAPVNRNTVAVVLAHEYTHTIEGTDAYTKLADAVFNSTAYSRMLATAGRNGEGVLQEEYLQQIIDDYDKGGASLGNTDAEKLANAKKEAIAKFLSEYALQDVNTLIDLARTDRTWFGDLYAQFRRYIARLRGKLPNNSELVKVERLFAKAAKASNSGAVAQKSPATTSGVQYSLEPYSQHQIDNWQSSKRIVVYESDAQLLQFVQNARDDSSFVKKMYFGIVGEDLSQRIKRDTGIETKGLNVTLRADNVRKIFRDHGTEQTESPRGQRPITSLDFAKIPEVIGSPESIEKGSYLGKEAITFRKTINQSRVTIFAVNSGASSLDLYVQTMFAGQKKDGGIAYTADANSPTHTSETPVGTAPITSIPDSSQKSNTQYSLPSQSISGAAYSLSVRPAPDASSVWEGDVAHSDLPNVDGDLVDSQYIEKVLADPTVSEETKDWLRRNPTKYEVYRKAKQMEDARAILSEKDGVKNLVKRIAEGHIPGAAEMTALQMMQDASRSGETQGRAVQIAAMGARRIGQALGSITHHKVNNYGDKAPAERRAALIGDYKQDAVQQTFDLQNKFIDRKYHRGAGDFIDSVVLKFGVMDGIAEMDAERLAQATAEMVRQTADNGGERSRVKQLIVKKLSEKRVQEDLHRNLQEQAEPMDALRLTLNKALGIRSMTTTELQTALGEGERIGKLIDNMYQAESEEKAAEIQVQVDAEIDRLFEYVCEHLTITGTERMNAWRKTAMLANVKTHFRNILSNISYNGLTGYGGIKLVDDAVATLLERFFVKDHASRSRYVGWAMTEHGKSIMDEVRKQTALEQRRMNSALGYANDSTANAPTDTEVNHEATAIRGLEFSESQARMRRKMFGDGDNLLNMASNLNSRFLEGEDAFSYTRAFKNELGQRMTAAGVTTATEEMIKASREAALYAVFRCDNALNSWVVQHLKTGGPQDTINKTTALRYVNEAFDALLPFTKTPSNLLFNLIDHSPAGLVKTLGSVALDLHRGNEINTTQLIGKLSRNITGTGAAILGYALAAMGFISLEEPEDWEYDELIGATPYALKIGNTYISTDWLQPTSGMFLIGAVIADGVYNGQSFFDMISGVGGLIFDQSYLQSVQQVFDTSDFGDGDYVTALGQNLAKSYITQFIPTLVGQLARTVDPVQRQVSEPDDFGKTMFNTVLSRIPFASMLLDPKLSVWGDQLMRNNVSDDMGGYLSNAVQQFVLPSTVTGNSYNDRTTLSLLELYEEAQAARRDIENDDTLTAAEKKKALDDHGTGSLFSDGDIGSDWTDTNGDLITDNEDLTYETTRLLRRTYKSYLDLLLPTDEFREADVPGQIDMVGEVYDTVNSLYKTTLKTMEHDDAVDTMEKYLDAVKSGKYDPDVVNAYATVKLADGAPLITNRALCNRYESAVKEIYEARIREKTKGKYTWTENGVKRTIIVSEATAEEKAFIEARELAFARTDIAELFKKVDAATLVAELKNGNAYEARQDLL